MSEPTLDAQQPRGARVDDSKAVCTYSNFCRVTGTPEEILIDFGLNDLHGGVEEASVEIKQRIVLSFFTAKRMINALHATVLRHEKVFGPIETNIEKRIVKSESVEGEQQKS